MPVRLFVVLLRVAAHEQVAVDGAPVGEHGAGAGHDEIEFGILRDAGHSIIPVELHSCIDENRVMSARSIAAVFTIAALASTSASNPWAALIRCVGKRAGEETAQAEIGGREESRQAGKEQIRRTRPGAGRLYAEGIEEARDPVERLEVAPRHDHQRAPQHEMT